MVKLLLLTAVIRTRQKAVFLCPVRADMMQPIFGGAIGPNTKPLKKGNKLSRLLAVVEPRHLNMAITKLTGGPIMSSSPLAVPADQTTIIPFPDARDWHARFNRIFDHGKAHLLCFPFSEIRHKQVLLELYDAAAQVLQKYPDVAREFYADADIGFGLAERAIARAREKRPAEEPGIIIKFRSMPHAQSKQRHP
jgi:hypothetical protein